MEQELWVLWVWSPEPWWWHVWLSPGWGSIFVVDNIEECITVYDRVVQTLKDGWNIVCLPASKQPFTSECLESFPGVPELCQIAKPLR